MGGEPWAQQVLNLKAAHRLTSGRGVVVAVVDSGVDFGNPQLKGQAAGAVDLTGSGNDDCAAHGTGIAGIIAARQTPKAPFVGVAPGARILSVKVAEDAENNSDLLLARGIVKAVRQKARVINVSAQTPTDSKPLRQAVAYALKNDVVVVAAAGNVDPKNTGTARPAYPAQYEGVLSVGAVDSTGNVTAFSDVATRVSVVAPGVGVTSTWPRSGWSFTYEGTSYAAPFVSGVAALVRAAHPGLTAPQVVRRIEATADGSRGLGSGYGMVNPLQAVSAQIPAVPVTAGPQAVQIPAAPEEDRRPENIALGVMGAALGTAAVALAVGTTMPHGRRRRWAPGGQSAR
ncbi:type VII secretion-associated serine protease mycosin [Actinocorallia sp. B10E7]|uniref:type VII secretion-associated serine protease mycosin n=1 Tax=Actinocorallia sp. B10E7 TaxID=3153558 RepID=UPI00325ED472